MRLEPVNLAAIQEHNGPVHLVLTDIKMPVMDGLTALPHIREASPESEVVVLPAATPA